MRICNFWQIVIIGELIFGMILPLIQMPFAYQGTEEQHINNALQNSPNTSILTPQNLMDGEIIEEKVSNFTTGEPQVFSVPSNKALKSIYFNSTSVNQTKNIIKNSGMDLANETNLWNWQINVTNNNTKGITLGKNGTDSIMALKIEGNQSTELYSCFKTPNYNDSFYDLTNWQINKIADSDYDITLGLGNLASPPPMDSDKIQSRGEFQAGPAKAFWGEINKTFFYNGTTDLNSAELSFYYQCEVDSNISVWILCPNASKVQIDNWYGFKDDLPQKIFNVTSFNPVIKENGNYTLIIRFEHWVGITPSYIYLDEVRFWINYTAREIAPNEEIHISQLISQNNTIIDSATLQFMAYFRDLTIAVNQSEIFFDIQIGSYIIPMGNISGLSVGIWKAYEYSIPQYIVALSNFTIIFKWKFQTQNITRFRANETWMVFYDNITLAINRAPPFEEINLTFSSSFPANSVQFSVKPQSNSNLSIFIAPLKDFWLRSDNTTFIIAAENGVDPYFLNGTWFLSFFSWRDYILNQTYNYMLFFSEYPTLVSKFLLNAMIPWQYLANFSNLFPHIMSHNWDWLLYEASSIDPWFGRLFSSYIFYMERTNQFQPQGLAYILNAIKQAVHEPNPLSYTENTIKSYINQLSSVTTLQYARLYTDLQSMTLEIPWNINLTKFRTELTIRQELFMQIRNGSNGALYLSSKTVKNQSLGANVVEFPALISWRSLLEQLIPQNINGLTNIPVQWIEYPYLMNETLQIKAGIPLLLQSESLFPNSYSHQIYTTIINQTLFYSLALFHVLFQILTISEVVEQSLPLFTGFCYDSSGDSNVTYPLNQNINTLDMNLTAVRTETSNLLYQDKILMSNSSKLTLNITVNPSQLSQFQSFNLLAAKITQYYPEIQYKETLIPMHTTYVDLSTWNITNHNTIQFNIDQPDTFWTTFLLHQYSFPVNGYIDPIIYVELKNGNEILAQNWSQCEILPLSQITMSNLWIPNKINTTLCIDNTTGRGYMLETRVMDEICIIPNNMLADLQILQAQRQYNLHIPILNLNPTKPITLTEIMPISTMNGFDLSFNNNDNAENGNIPSKFQKLDFNIDINSANFQNSSVYYINTTQAINTKAINQTIYTCKYDINFSSSALTEGGFKFQMELRLNSPIYATFPVPITSVIIGISMFLVAMGVIFILRQVFRFRKIVKNERG